MDKFTEFLRKKQEETYLFFTEKFKSFGSYIIIKISAHDELIGISNYKRFFFNDFIDENTLILVDENNDSFVVFVNDNKGKLTDECELDECLSIVPTIKYDKDMSIYRNKRDIIPVPDRILSLLKCYLAENEKKDDNISQISSKLKSLQLMKPVDKFIRFSEKNLIYGKAYVLKDVKNMPGWNAEFLNYVSIAKISFCKSCRQKAFSTRYNNKKCCNNYAKSNRTNLIGINDWISKDEAHLFE